MSQGSSRGLVRSGKWVSLYDTPQDPTGPIYWNEIPGVFYDEDTQKSIAPENALRLPIVAAALAPPEYRPEVDFQPSFSLYPHQLEGAKFLVRNRGGLLADQVGVGKTRSAIAAAEELCAQHVREHNLFPHVIIVGPVYVRDIWRRELEICGFPMLQCEGASAINKARPPKDEVTFRFIHYDIVEGWWFRLAGPQVVCVILDEAHLLKNSKTHRAKGAAMVASGNKPVIALTGTPLVNRVGDFHNILSLVTGPKSWGHYIHFIKRYGGAIHDGYGWREQSPTHLDELHQRLEGVYLRREIGSIGVQLPSFTRQTVSIDATEVDLETYRSYEVEFNPAGSVLASVGKARKLCTKIKFPTVLGELQACIEQNEPVVCFVWQRQTAEALAKKVTDALFLHGGMSQDDRDQAVRDFQAGKGSCLIATYGALAAGVTLHRARIVFMIDIEWDPATMLQAEARLYRLGQLRPVLSKWFIANETFDVMAMSHILRKATTINEVLDDTELAKLAHQNHSLGSTDLQEDY